MLEATPFWQRVLKRTNAGASRTALGITEGVLPAAPADSDFLVGDGADWVQESGTTARTSMGVAIGSDVQAHDAVLDDLAALAVVADNEFVVGAGAGTYAHESGATARTSLGLGTAALLALAQADQAALEAETDEDTYAPPDLLRHSPIAAKMWVKFDIAGTVNASYNVDSITDTGTGDWTIVITTNFSSVDYAFSATIRDNIFAGSSADMFIFGVSQNSGDLQINVMEGSSGNLADIATGDDMHVVAFGDQ